MLLSNKMERAEREKEKEQIKGLTSLMGMND